mgnify:CR=1 FL=1
MQDTSQLRWWLLGFGEQVEVIKPAHLREEFRKTAQKLGFAESNPSSDLNRSDAAAKINLSVPLVVRLEGTNAKKAGELLNNSPLDFLVADSLSDAAEKAVTAARGGVA